MDIDILYILKSIQGEIKVVSKRLDAIELAVSDTSHRVKDIYKDLARVARNTGENLAEIIELKAVR